MEDAKIMISSVNPSKKLISSFEFFIFINFEKFLISIKNISFSVQEQTKPFFNSIVLKTLQSSFNIFMIFGFNSISVKIISPTSEELIK